jgi:hypothetical protein
MKMAVEYTLEKRWNGITLKLDCDGLDEYGKKEVEPFTAQVKLSAKQCFDLANDLQFKAIQYMISEASSRAVHEARAGM